MSIKLPANKKFCGTAEAAKIYGCSERHIRYMVATKQIRFCQSLGARSFAYDADEIKALAADRESQRKAGKLGGRRPGSQAS